MAGRVWKINIHINKEKGERKRHETERRGIKTEERIKEEE